MENNDEIVFQFIPQKSTMVNSDDPLEDIRLVLFIVCNENIVSHS